MKTHILLLRARLGLLLILTVFVSPTLITTAQDDEAEIRITQVDSSQFPQVTVYVSATDATGEPLGIDPDQIRLSENGEPVEIQDISGKGEFGPLTTLLVIDVSGSMLQAGKLEAAKAAATAYVDKMRTGDKAGLLAFNTRLDYTQPITDDRRALKRAIAGLRAKNDTAMYDALNRAASILKGVSGRKAVIVLADGLDNVSKVTATDVIEKLGSAGLSVSSIGLGNPGTTGVNSGLDEDALRSLAEGAGGIYGYADDPRALSNLYERYGRALQSEYAITYTTPGTLRDGINRALTVSLASTAGVAPAEARYNPGGVLPEVGEIVSWPVFAGLLAALLLLVFLPGLLRLGGQAFGARSSKGKTGPKGRIRLSEAPPVPKANIRLK